jgi:1-acyl-sn-glycerol-3-phosphate acyltransferase
MRRLVDRLLGFLARRILRIYFRRIEVVGGRKIPQPADGVPLVVVANHVNGLIDPMFVVGTLRLPARLLGKSTLWKIPLLAQILDLAGVIPVYRRQDEGVDRSRNLESFARSHEVLAKGGVISIFPEGTSHDEPQLQPLRTGASRILLEAEERFGPLGSRILPVGLHFEERERFRSRALVVVGDPIDPAEEVELYRTDTKTAVRALTDRVAVALEGVTLNYSSWEEARLVERGARLLEIDELDMPRERRLGAEFESRRDLLEGLAYLRASHPAAVEAAVVAARDYDALLRGTGLRDEQVVSSYPIEKIAGYLARQIVRAVVALPFALVGMVVHALPYLLIHGLARRVRHEPNQVATYKVFPGIVLYPLTWAIFGYFAWRRGGWPAGVAMYLLAPITGGIAIRFLERLERFGREARAFLLLKGRRGLAEELRARRRRVTEKIDTLVEFWTEAQAFDPDSRRGMSP